MSPATTTREVIGPLRAAEDLPRATAAVIDEQLRFELRQLLARLDITQTTFAQRIGYGEGTISRWKSGQQRLSDGGAKSIDLCGFGSTTLGLSFSEMLRAYRAARQVSADLVEHDWDVFLSSPMAATGSVDRYSSVVATAMEFSAAMESACEWSVYFAGNGIPTPNDFDGADQALALNYEALRRSRYFVMLVLEEMSRPSSILVEAGMALALNKPSVYLVRDRTLLPYVLREAPQHRSHGSLPPVRIYEVEGLAQAVGRVNRHKGDLFPAR